MKRHYYISNDLDDLESLEITLEKAGLDTEQIHVLSNDDARVKSHHLNAVDSISKKDVIRSGVMGLGIGIIGAAAILFFSYRMELSDSAAWAPALFLSFAFLGFCTWEGGLWGIQKTNRDFARFQKDLADGKHVFFVDIKPRQERVLEEIISNHPKLVRAGLGDASPEWVMGAHKGIHKFMHWAP